ncbi:MAG: hypothetical protein AAGM22_23765 [Acidobacteriota bacterium]
MARLTSTPFDNLSWLPQTLVLLGTDAAGKNHVARVWVDRLTELGRAPAVQEGWLSSTPAPPRDDDDKSVASHLAEALFLRVFPLIAWAMPTVLHGLLRRDLRRFPRDRQNRLVVSHSVLRILAFCLGARGRSQIPPRSASAVEAFRRGSGAVFIVLDVDHEVRRRRIEDRVSRDDADPFDRYMLADAERSERIEACLVQLATQHLGAHLIVNNNLDDGALWRELETACRAAEPQGPGAAART